MTPQQREHPEAVEEFDAAVAWYEDRAPGTGLRLIDRATKARHDIGTWPDAAPIFPGWAGSPIVRAKSIPGFPYSIVNAVHNSALVILAYAHESRQPGYWLHRLES